MHWQGDQLHLPSSGSISYGMCAFAKRCWQIKVCISCCMSISAGKHRVLMTKGSISQGLSASSKTNQPTWRGVGLATFVIDSHIGRDLLHITQEIARMERLWHVHITEPSSSLAFLNSHWPAKNIQLNSDMVYLHCSYNALLNHCWLWTTCICGDLCTSLRRCQAWTTSINLNLQKMVR